MSRIKSKDTGPELIVRRLLWRMGYRYRLYQKDLPGKPDIVFRKQKKAIIVNGCFWHNHGCSKFKWPTSNIDFWKKKISDNVVRDNKNYSNLLALGWKILILWQCELSKDEELILKLTSFVQSPNHTES